MYSIIIVDDEDMTRRSLEKHIDWVKLGVTVLDSFSNGESALEYCRNTMPDIVITDVRMPKMNGIELATELRKLSVNCKIIFLSGFADKEYLKSAISLQALNYIEKPIRLEEVTQAVMLAVQQCHSEKANQQRCLQGLLLMRQQLTLALVSGEPECELTEKFGEVYLDFASGSSFTASCFLPNTHLVEIRSADRNKQLEEVYGFEGFVNEEAGFIAAFDKSGHLVVLQNQTVLTTSFTDSGVGRLFQFLSTLTGWSMVSVGISLPVNHPGDLHTAFEQASKAAQRQFYEGVGYPYFPLEHQMLPYQPSQTDLARFHELLQGSDSNQTLGFLEDLLRQAEETHYEVLSLKNFYFQLLLAVFEASRRYKLIGSTQNGPGSIWQEIYATPTLDLLHNLLVGSVTAYYDNTCAQEGYSKKVMEIQQYIRDNFTSRELTIQSIAQHMYISNTYLCALFKKATGQTLNEYITLQRIERAKELLHNPHIKIYEIADSIGLLDINYFSTLFKRYTGCTPSEYRNGLL